jgi:hypothetical protein
MPVDKVFWRWLEMVIMSNLMVDRVIGIGMVGDVVMMHMEIWIILCRRRWWRVWDICRRRRWWRV